MTDLPRTRQGMESAWRRYLGDRNSPVLDMALAIEDAGRPRVKAAVVRLAHAQGLEETRKRLRELQAECLAWEACFPEEGEDDRTRSFRGPRLAA